MESIRKFADEFHASGKKLHMLLNCHGFKPHSSTQLSLSTDNFEQTMAANHLGQCYDCVILRFTPFVLLAVTVSVLAYDVLTKFCKGLVIAWALKMI